MTAFEDLLFAWLPDPDDVERREYRVIYEHLQHVVKSAKTGDNVRELVFGSLDAMAWLVDAMRTDIEQMRTHRAVPTGPSNGYYDDGRFLAQYFDDDMKRWLNIGDPHYSEKAALDAASSIGIEIAASKRATENERRKIDPHA